MSGTIASISLFHYFYLLCSFNLRIECFAKESLTSQWFYVVLKNKLIIQEHFLHSTALFLLGPVHILCQPPKGGEGVRQRLTIDDHSEKGGRENVVDLWQGGGGIWKPPHLADLICGQHLKWMQLHVRRKREALKIRWSSFDSWNRTNWILLIITHPKWPYSWLP